MKTYYKVYSVGKDAQPSYIQDGDGSVLIMRKQNPIGRFDSPIHYHLDKYHGIQRTKQNHSIDCLDEINSTEITILRKTFLDNSKDCTPYKPNVKKFYTAKYDDTIKDDLGIRRNIPKHYALEQDMDCSYVRIEKGTYGLIGYSPQPIGLNKTYDTDYKAKSCDIINTKDDDVIKQYPILFGAHHCDIYDLNYLYHTQDYSVPLKTNDARTRVGFQAKPLTHIFKEYSCNVVSTRIAWWKYINSGGTAKFKYKKTAESPRQRAFKVNSVLVTSLDTDKQLNGASTNVIQRTSVVVDNAVGNISLVIQKMEFFELKLNGVASVTNLPDGVEYKNDSIKGTIADSGEYFIDVKYNNDAKQVINIIVPFYRRLL